MNRPHPHRTTLHALRTVALLVPLLAAAAPLSGCAVGRGIEALKLLTDIAASQADPGAPIDGVARLDVPDAGTAQGDLYLPTQGSDETAEPLPAAAALVLVPGLAATGKDDPRIVALARILARSHIAVLVPDIASLRELRAGPENIVEIAAALRFLGGGGRGLWTQSATVGDLTAMPAHPIGVAAISYAVGPALLATLEPDLAGQVGFLVGVGGYHDITASLTYITTGWYHDADGAWRQGAPNAYGKWAFVMANAARVESPADRTSLDAMARRRLADLDAPVDDLVAGLGPEGSAVHALVTNQDRERVADLIAALPAPIRDDMTALDLAARDLSAAPPALLLHGRDDAIIPASESVALAQALGPQRTRLILLDSLAHADLGLDSLGDVYRMWRAAYWLLAARDGAL